MPRIGTHNLLDCVVIIRDKMDSIVGLGAVLERGNLILHKNSVSNAQKYGFNFAKKEEIKLQAYLNITHKSVAIMQVSCFKQQSCYALKTARLNYWEIFCNFLKNFLP